jgi:hypothetical protein
MFVVDLIAASLLAVVLTTGFAAIVGSRYYRRVSALSGKVWLMSFVSWAGGILVVAFGPALTGTHWLPFAVTGFLIGLLVLVLPKFPNFKHIVQMEMRDPGEDARPAIALYFFVTLFLFFCAISLRFYIVNLA